VLAAKGSLGAAAEQVPFSSLSPWSALSLSRKTNVEAV